MGTDPNSPDNRWLRDAMEHQIPVGILPRSCARSVPADHFRHSSWAGTRRACGSSLPSGDRRGLGSAPPPPGRSRATLCASRGRRPSERRPDRLRRPLCDFPTTGTSAPRRSPHRDGCRRPQLGQPIIPNGLPLSEIDHAAFDAHLIGIDPDFRIHVSDRLLDIRDGPFLELGLKGIVGQVIEMPRRREDYPDRDRLARKFERFKSASNGASTRSRRCSLSGGADIETRRRPLARLSITRSRPVLDGALYFAVILRALLCSNLKRFTV